MTLTAVHAKTVTIADITQAQLNTYISQGFFPAGTTLADIALASDWNANHTITGTLPVGSITGLGSIATDEASEYMRTDGTSTTVAPIPFAQGIEVTGIDDGNSTNPAIFVHCGSTTSGINFGIRFDGNYTDGISFDGVLTGSTGIFNYFAYHDGSYFLPPATGKSAWSYSSGMKAIGSTNIDNVYGFVSRPSAGSGTPNIPYTGTIGDLSCFKAELSVLAGATVTEHNLFKGEIVAALGTITTQYGINLPDINAGATNYAIRTRAGSIQFGALATAGFVKSSATGLLSVDTASYQPLDSTLTSLAAYNTNGILTQTAADTFTGRTITGTTNRITLTNGSGVSGNPTIDISSSYVGQNTITTLGTITTGVWNGTDIAFANIAQGSALSVLGVTGNATADVGSIAAGTDNQVLRRSGTSLAFGAVNLASTNAVTGQLPYTNIRNVTNGNFLGNFSGADTTIQEIGTQSAIDNIFASLETGAIDNVGITYLMGQDAGLGYCQNFAIIDVVVAVATYLASTTFGQPAQRVDVVTKTASYTLTNFDGLVECNATGGAFAITTATLQPGRQITIVKTDASVNAVTVQTNIFGGSVILATQGQSVTIRLGSSTTWYVI